MFCALEKLSANKTYIKGQKTELACLFFSGITNQYATTTTATPTTSSPSPSSAPKIGWIWIWTAPSSPAPFWWTTVSRSSGSRIGSSQRTTV